MWMLFHRRMMLRGPCRVHERDVLKLFCESWYHAVSLLEPVNPYARAPVLFRNKYVTLYRSGL